MARNALRILRMRIWKPNFGGMCSNPGSCRNPSLIALDLVKKYYYQLSSYWWGLLFVHILAIILWLAIVINIITSANFFSIFTYIYIYICTALYHHQSLSHDDNYMWISIDSYNWMPIFIILAIKIVPSLSHSQPRPIGLLRHGRRRAGPPAARSGAALPERRGRDSQHVAAGGARDAWLMADEKPWVAC